MGGPSATALKMNPITTTSDETVWDWPFQGRDGVVKVTNTDDKFEVGLEALFFTPKEIEVKVLNDELIVHCRHEKTNDKFGFIEREVHRAYHLPSDVDSSTLKSHLNKDGTLFISADKKH